MIQAEAGRLKPEPGGALIGRTPVPVVLNSARFQAVASPGGVSEIFIWGSGAAGKVAFDTPEFASAATRITPNRVELRSACGLLVITALPDLPAIVFEASGEAPRLRLVLNRRLPAGFATGARLTRLSDGWRSESPWAAAELRSPGGRAVARGGLELGPGGQAVLGLGEDVAEARGACEVVLADLGRALAGHSAYLARVSSVLTLDDALLSSMFAACLHTALSSRKELAGGRFAGFAAGTGYVMPPRTYFRDSYWTVQTLLPLRPELAREQLLLLARGVHDDGEAPSGVIVASPAGERAWRAMKAADPALAADHQRSGEWWGDHFDSPYYFVLLAREVAAWTADAGLLFERVAGRTIGESVKAVLDRAERLCAGTGLPIKPDHDRDWADNVFRSGYVTYDAGLYHGALLAAAELFEAAEPSLAARYRARAAAARAEATGRLFEPATGHFVEFRPGQGSGGEDHLALDSLTALRFGLASEDQARLTLQAVRASLETRNNPRQPYGDWGVMSVFPAYRPGTKRRAKSRFPYRYHNGSDWPYLDGIYAEALLLRGDADWRYPLTRWWSYGLAQGWPTPVEYYAPPWGRGSALNGWSAMPAAAMLLGGFGLRPSGLPKPPPWGDCELSGVLVGGRRSRVRVVGKSLEVEPDG